jgi:hypothetical protein
MFEAIVAPLARAERGTPAVPAWKLWIRRVVREPFVHFVLLGAVLFVVNEQLESHSKFTHIRITPEIVNSIAENYRLQYGFLPSQQQLDSLVESYIREEVFYHQALKLGLDRDDEIIRRRLVQKYEFVQQDLDVTGAPTDDELRGFYNQHREHYQQPAKVTFTHVYFSPDARGEAGARTDAARASVALAARGLRRAPDSGDVFPGPTDFAAHSTEELARVFGHEGLETEVFNADLDRWSGPIRSGLGWHLVYVSSKQPPRLQSFEAARDGVRRDYLDAARARRNAQTYQELRKNFVIERE